MMARKTDPPMGVSSISRLAMFNPFFGADNDLGGAGD